MQLRSYVLYAGSSLWISPSKCLGLEPKWHCHFGIPRQHRRLYHVSTLMVGRLGDLWEWTVLNHQHSPSVPQITMLEDMRVAVLSSKRYSNLIPKTIIRSHSTIAQQRYSSIYPHRFTLVVTPLIMDKGDNRSLGAIKWTSCVHNCTRTMVPCVP